MPKKLISCLGKLLSMERPNGLVSTLSIDAFYFDHELVTSGICFVRLLFCLL